MSGILCPTCEGEGGGDHLACEDGRDVEQWVSCATCAGYGSLGEDELVDLPLPVLVDMHAMRGGLDDEALVRLVVHQACVAECDPAGTFPAAWKRVPAGLRERIDALVARHFDPIAAE